MYTRPCSPTCVPVTSHMLRGKNQRKGRGQIVRAGVPLSPRVRPGGRRVLLGHVFRRAGANTQATGTQADTLQIAATGGREQRCSTCSVLFVSATSNGTV